MKKEKLGFQIKEDVEKDEIQLRPSQSKAVFKLISLNTEEEYILSGEKSFIGRSAENDICINYKTVSGRHCVLEKKENTFFIRDLQSSNGTYVNGKRLGEAEAELKNGYILSFANNKFKFAVVDLPTKEQKKSTKVISVCSGEGGCGKTSLLLSLAKDLSEKGYEALYIDAESINTFQCSLGNDNFKYAESAENLRTYEALSYKKLKSSVVKTNYGFDVFSPVFGSAEMNDIKVESYLSIIKLIVINKEYDFLLVDTDTQIGEMKTALIGMSDLVFALRSDRRAAKEKQDILSALLDLKNERFVMVVNEFSVAQRGVCPESFNVRNLDRFPNTAEMELNELIDFTLKRVKNA